MDVLWAPWRMAYIEYAKIERGEGCFICKAVESSELEENLVVYKGEKIIVMLNRYPYNTGHLLVAPTRHVADFSQLSDEELFSLAKAVSLSLELLKKALSPDGFNVGVNLGRVAGAGLESHLHVHVVPRWNGDTNFMPVIADAKVIPEALKDTRRKLLKHVDVFEGLR
ncbi:histidine triad (HIT) protein [Thermofilum pendens Hrk 5]|uniref:Histidine triad (HIT) protein n=1 Tax=Thermofilum pendens (strain DSM 2475 / Hrk 5) TaxID=368408 RepID=A1RXN8_THEPD|nr:HIT domain-containing protein [Thermofilum pendens]ABL77968.1 histidine triad (HIT) protein [Thermofilum pendens Hrk 5]